MATENLALLKNITVLYAEDEKNLREVTTNILVGFTKKQFIAEDGVQGLELFKENQNEIDLVITDINMPNMNGLDMAKSIKEINPNIPIIVATAFSNTEYLLEAINMGIDKYVLKPVDIKKLLKVMSQSLLYHELKDLYTDNLTHLPNRNKLKKDLNETDEDLMALINIDKFSTINDLFGEENGDNILYEFSQRLRNIFDEERFRLYRVEADKFAVISKDLELEVDEFKVICESFAKDIEDNEIEIDGNGIDINTTIGIAKSKDHDAYKHTQRVISYARNKYKQIMVYDESFNIGANIEENIMWVKKIKSGLKNGDFKAYFQPIVDSKSQKVYKFEALIRYIEEDGTAISPFKFLDIAKKARLYPEIIKVMIVEAFNAIKSEGIRVSLNISYEDIIIKESVEFIIGVLEANREYTHMLEFEVLESEQIDNFEAVSNFINLVKKYDCAVGVDDFGAGYSNFNMLTQLDLDFVKIDGSLIKKIDTDANLKTIVETIISFAEKVGYKTIAEFVASEEIYNVVSDLGTDYCQGYYFDAPLSMEELRAKIQAKLIELE